MTKPICGGEKYTIGGPKEDTIALPVIFSGLPATTKVEGHTLNIKSSFHVSLVCIGKIVEKHKIEIPDFMEKIVSDFCDFIKNNPVDIIRYRGEFRFAVQNERCAVVAMCDVSNLDKFFKLINEKYNLQLKYPPTHVTLYTLQPDKGIFLTDLEDIETLTKLIDNPGLEL